jgi:competence protein ComEA
MRRHDSSAEAPSRTEVARRRLAALAASFEDQAPPARAADLGALDRPRSHAAEVAWRIPPVRVQAVLAVVVAAGVLLSWWLLSARPRTSEPEAVRLTAQTDRGQRTGAEANSLVIDVEGKVKRPGIVTLPRGSRVHEAIARAGGALEGADTSAINLARVLADGEQVIVGVAAAGGPPGVGAVGGGAASGGRISLNTATLEQLDTLPGIGPVTAQAIVDYRTSHGGFQRVEDLLNVKGIGDATLADVKDQVSP